MRKKKRHWVWNLVILLTLVLCSLAFTAHYKNWVRLKDDHFSILSGIYYKELYYARLDSVFLVEKIPRLERISGFSAWALEKGVFKDSLNPGKKVYVFVDDLSHPKIKLVQRDSLVVFLNFADTTETRQMYEFLQARKSPGNTGLLPDN